MIHPSTPAPGGRKYLLDVLRGIAALAVVLYHWEHFTIPGMGVPLAGALDIFYRTGAFAVPMFFSLSGFVFFWLYAGRIHAGDVGAARFAGCVYRGCIRSTWRRCSRWR